MQNFPLKWVVIELRCHSRCFHDTFLTYHLKKNTWGHQDKGLAFSLLHDSMCWSAVLKFQQFFHENASFCFRKTWFCPFLTLRPIGVPVRDRYVGRAIRIPRVKSHLAHEHELSWHKMWSDWKVGNEKCWGLACGVNIALDGRTRKQMCRGSLNQHICGHSVWRVEPYRRLCLITCWLDLIDK